MSIDSKDIENIAQLAQLHLDADAVANATSSIVDILALIDKMQSVSTENVRPLSHNINASQRLRDDIVTETDQRDRLQQVAPSVDKGLFLVPKVIE